MRRAKIVRLRADQSAMQDADDGEKGFLRLRRITRERAARPQPPVDHEKARRLCHSYDAEVLFGRLSTEAVAEALGVHIVTVRAWRRGARPISPAARKALRLLNGDLGALHPAWEGWQLLGEELRGPDGLSFRGQEILAGPFFRQLAMAYQSRQRFEIQADWVDQRWTSPGENEKPSPTDTITDATERATDDSADERRRRFFERRHRYGQG